MTRGSATEQLHYTETLPDPIRSKTVCYRSSETISLEVTTFLTGLSLAALGRALRLSVSSLRCGPLCLRAASDKCSTVKRVRPELVSSVTQVNAIRR